MAITLTDQDIGRLISESKQLPVDYQRLFQLKPKRGHKEAEFDIKGETGSEFKVILRQSEINSLDFSVILAYRIPGTNILFRLRRYNGKSHEHTNKIEGNRLYDFHIHTASERYQDSGFREDSFAEPATTYADFAGAVQTILRECGFQKPPSSQSQLFD